MDKEDREHVWGERETEDQRTFPMYEFHSCTPALTLTVFCIKPALTTTACICRPTFVACGRGGLGSQDLGALRARRMCRCMVVRLYICFWRGIRNSILPTVSYAGGWRLKQLGSWTSGLCVVRHVVRRCRYFEARVRKRVSPRT